MALTVSAGLSTAWIQRTRVLVLRWAGPGVSFPLALLPRIALSFCITASPALGQVASEERQFGPWVWGVSGGAVQQFEAGMQDGAGDFDVTRAYFQPSLGYAWDRRNSVSLSVGYGSSDYSFSGESTIDGLSPWGRIEDYRVSLPVRFSVGERSDAILIPSIRSHVEAGTSLAEGRTEGVIAGMSWRFSDKLSLGPGFGWYSELDGGSNAFPIVVVDWSITDRLSLTTGRGLAASQGPGLSLNYALADKWTLGLAGRYEKTRFALGDDSAAPGGIGEDRSLPLLLTVEYTPWPMTKVSAVIGAEFEGELRLEDENGRRIGSSSYDAAPVVGVVFSTRF